LYIIMVGEYPTSLWYCVTGVAIFTTEMISIVFATMSHSICSGIILDTQLNC
jgi:hypothetical protein